MLAAEGWEVHAPRTPRCCGALQLHTGYAEDARALARETIAAFEGFDVVVVNAAGCGSALKDYGHLFRDDPAWAERAAAFSAKVRDVSELLAEHEPVAPRHPVPLARRLPRRLPPRPRPGRPRPAARAAARDPGARAARARRVGDLLRLGRRLQPAASPSPRRELGGRKARNLLATGADARRRGQPRLRAADRRCAPADLGRELRVVHPMEILHASIEGRMP